MRRMLMIVLSLFFLTTSFCLQIKAEDEETMNGNVISLQVKIEDVYKDLIEINKECYSLKGIEYTVYRDDSENSEIAVFVLDENGKGIDVKTGKDYVDGLPDGDYYFEMTKANEYFRLDNREQPFSLSSKPVLPDKINVTTVAELYGKNSSNNYFSNNKYKLWTTDYGIGVFECGVAEVSAPASIVSYGTHTISTKSAKVLNKTTNELIYKILYYGRKGPAQWSGFTSGKYNVPFATRDGSSYYSTSKSQALAAFVTHVCLSRAYNANSKWNLQWSQDGVADYWKYVNSAPNAPENFVVYIWENFKSNGTQDMFFGFLSNYEYTKKELKAELSVAFDPISLVLTKKDSGDIAVKKAGFEISYYPEYFDKLEEVENKKATRSWLFETDENGRLTYSNINKVNGDDLFVDEATGNNILLAGSYIVKEVYAPKGYILSEPFIIKVYADIDKQPEYLNASGSRLLTNEANGLELLEEKEGYALVNKRAKQETSLSLLGAKYGIFVDENCTFLAKDTLNNEAILVTDQNGNTNTIAIAPGNYYVKEIEAPAGFKLDENIYPIKVEEMSTAIVESVEEIYQIELFITKQDSLTKEKVGKAIYGVYSDDNEFVERIVLDEHGEGSICLDYEPKGYYLKELEAPEHYVIDEGVYPITGKSDEDVKVYLDLKDDPRVFRLRVVKVDELGKPLASVGFQLIDDNDEIVKDAYGNPCVGLTDDEGNLEFILFEKGKYYLVETSTIQGYHLDSTHKEIVVSEDVKTGKIDELLEAFTIEVINYKVPVAETGDREFIVFSFLAVASFIGLVSMIRLKQKYVK